MTRALILLVSYPGQVLSFFLALALMARRVLVSIDRKRTEWLLGATMVAVPLGMIAEFFVERLSWLCPLKYDQYVYRIDSRYGQPSFVLGRAVYPHLWLRVFLGDSYALLPLVIVGVFAVTLWRCSEAEALGVARAFAVNLLAAVPLYLLFPVCGPKFAFVNFPYQQPLHLAPHLIALGAAPNGIPSVHMSSALLIAWFLRHWSWGRIAGGTYLVLTVLATLGLGQHYVFDLLCGVPYAIAVYWISYRIDAVPVEDQTPLTTTAT